MSLDGWHIFLQCRVKNRKWCLEVCNSETL